MYQSLDMVAVQFPGRRHFLEFFSHKVFYCSRPPKGTALLKIVSSQKPREIAAQVLAGRKGGEFVEFLLDRALAPTRLSPADRRLCQELVYGIVRWQATLDWLIARKTDARPQKPLLQCLLRLGLYQIFWLERIPNHAAVNETVELAKHTGFGAQTGFINAILRGYLREFEATRQLLADLKVRQPALGYSHPEWLATRWQERWGPEKAAQLMTWNNTPPKTFARVNTLKTDAAKLLVQWRDEDVEYDFFRLPWAGEAEAPLTGHQSAVTDLIFELKSHPLLTCLPSFQQGLFYIQDPGTLLAVQELGPQPGETILDLCAAPGGKLTYIAQLMGDEGRLIAHDTSVERIALIQENCARLGATCVQPALPATDPSGHWRLAPGNWPSSQHPTTGTQSVPAAAAQSSKFGVQGSRFSSPAPHLFDRILIDAPCSNTGVMRRRVDLRWRIRVEELSRLRAAQLELLGNAAPLLRPGGTLVYSTCSLEPEENHSVVREFLTGRPEFKLERERELLPFADGVDGAYVARISKRPSS
jgi:16S rRNA (cytosine967-C5)-methyltransferase